MKRPAFTVTVTTLKTPHSKLSGPSPGKLKAGVRSKTERSNTLAGSTVKGTVTGAAGGPKVSATAADSGGGAPVGRAPSDSGCSGSVNSMRIVVSGSTSVCPLPGEITGVFSGGGVVAISGRSVSVPTVVA